MQVYIAELGDDEVEDVRVPHPLDFVFELKELEDVAHILGKDIDIADEMLIDVIGVAPQFFEVERRMVMKALARNLVESGVECIAFQFSLLPSIIFLKNLRFGFGEHTIEAPKDRSGQHDAFILWWAVGTA